MVWLKFLSHYTIILSGDKILLLQTMSHHIATLTVTYEVYLFSVLQVSLKSCNIFQRAISQNIAHCIGLICMVIYFSHTINYLIVLLRFFNSYPLLYKYAMCKINDGDDSCMSQQSIGV